LRGSRQIAKPFASNGEIEPGRLMPRIDSDGLLKGARRILPILLKQPGETAAEVSFRILGCDESVRYREALDSFRLRFVGPRILKDTSAAVSPGCFKKNWKDAASSFEKSVAIDRGMRRPGSISPLLATLGNLTGAAQALEKALAVNPHNTAGRRA